MALTLSNSTVALVTYYQGYTKVVFTGINKSITLDSSVVLTIDKLELLAKALV